MNIDEEFRFDVRIQDRMVKKGLVTKEELEQRLAQLKDSESDSEVLPLEQPGLAPLHADSEGDRG
jgi:hypothetical protein